MNKIKVTKEEAKRLMEIEGNARGLAFKTTANYIIKKEGQGGLEKVEKKLKDLGYPLELEHTSSFGWYPVGSSALVNLILMEDFGWNEKDIFDMAYEGPIQSIVSKLVIHSLTIEKVCKNFQNYWQEYCDLGQWEVASYNIEKKNAILYLKDFKKYYPAVYSYFMGFLKKIFEIVTKSQNVEIKQTKNIFNGDPYDEFKVKW